VVLRALHELPPSFESLEQRAAEWEQTAVDDRPLPLSHLGRGRATLLLCSLAGLASFFAPWLVLTKPDIVTLSGFDLAGARGFWFAGGAVAWFINLPLIATRRSVNQMRGARLVVTLFCSLTAFQAVLLWLLAPTESFVPLSYHWGWGFYASAVISVIGTALAVRFGGAISDPEQRDSVPVANTDEAGQDEAGQDDPSPTLH
jgi:hypothetical protein